MQASPSVTLQQAAAAIRSGDHMEVVQLLHSIMRDFCSFTAIECLHRLNLSSDIAVAVALTLTCSKRMRQAK